MGKSTIASEVCRRLHASNQLGASFFFMRSTNGLNTPRLFFSTIAKQLARSQADIRPHIVTAARPFVQSASNLDMDIDADLLLNRPTKLLYGHATPVVIVVDALDECTDCAKEQISQMLGWLLTSAQGASFPLRILLTTRSSTHIDAVLNTPAFAPHVKTLSLDTLRPDQAQADIAVFLRNQLSQLPSSQRLFGDYPDIVNRLAERMDGFFPYARSIIDYLKGDPDHVYPQVGKFLTDGPARAILQPLDAMYRGVLQQAFPSERLEADDLQRPRVRSMLGYIAVAQEPLTPLMLESLTRVPCANAVSVLNVLRPVIRFEFTGNQNEATFSSMHRMFTEFLQDRSRCTDAVYCVDGNEEHERLAEGCLRTLLSLPVNICQLSDRDLNKPIRDVFDREDRARRYIAPHVRYACVHWATHLRASQKTKELVSLTRKFAGANPMRMWMATLGYIGKLDLAANALTQASVWLEVRCALGQLIVAAVRTA